MLAVTGCLALRSPIVLLTAPTLAWRFLSNNPAYWGTAYQYSPVLMPLVFAACGDALARLDGGAPRRPPAVAIRRIGLVVNLVVTGWLLPDYPLWTLARSEFWHTDARIAAAHEIMAEIPDNATVAAGNQLVPQLTDRDAVSLLSSQTPAKHPVWVLIDTEYPDDFPLRTGQQAQTISKLEYGGYHIVTDRDGYLLLKR